MMLYQQQEQPVKVCPDLGDNVLCFGPWLSYGDFKSFGAFDGNRECSSGFVNQLNCFDAVTTGY